MSTARFLTALVALCAAFLLVSCGEAPSNAVPTPNDHKDTAESPTNAHQGPPRIVALSPAIAVILRDLGLEQHVVGRHDYDLIDINAAPPVGHQDNIDYEALLATDPTHVLTQWGDRDLPPRLRSLAQERGWQLHDFTLLSLDDLVVEADQIHALFSDLSGEPPPSRRLRPALSTSGGPPDAPANPEPRRFLGHILLLASLSPPAALGPGSVHHDILTSLGALPAIDNGGPWQEMDAEDILHLAPDGIILIDPRPIASDGPTPTGPKPDPIPQPLPDLGRLDSLPIPAVKQRRVAVINHPLAFLPATSLAEVADQMRQILDDWSRTSQRDHSPPPSNIAP